MHRFFIEVDLRETHEVALSEGDSWHALKVLRLEPGARVALLNGAGSVGEGILTEVSRTRTSARLESVRTFPPSPVQVALTMALAKGRAMDWVIEKGTELGVAEIAFVACRRSVAQVASDEVVEKAAKWRAASLEALKQCGGAWLPRFSFSPSVAARLQAGGVPQLRMVAALHPSARPLHQVLDAFYSTPVGFPASVEVWIGPEGDFVEEELGLLVSGGVVPVSLGPNVLRCETAAITCAGILQHEARRWVQRH